MFSRVIFALAFLLIGWPAIAQKAAPAGMSPNEAMEKRFPQPVRVGSLLNRTVLQPVESKVVLGRVQNVVRQSDGTIDVVVDYGGWFGFFSHPIAVPVTAMVLLGEYMEIVDFTPKQLDEFKTFDAAGTTPVPPETEIKVGLAKPSH